MSNTAWAYENKKLGYRRGIVRRTLSVELFSTAAQLNEKKITNLKRLEVDE